MISSKRITSEELYDITLRSAGAQSKQVYIYELWELSDFLSSKQSEEIRELFLRNKVSVKQITNDSAVPEFSKNTDFVNKVMQFRFVSSDIFTIKKEILIFDDIVAIYDHEEILIIQDEVFSMNQKQLFENIWNEGISPKLDFTYTPNHSFYNSIDLEIWGKQMIVWPDAESIDSYTWYNKESLQNYMQDIYDSDIEYFWETTYFIVFIWSLDWAKMADVWKFDENPVDDRSWPLSEVRVYKNKEICNNIGLASGNTLMVLGYEEKVRRQSQDLRSYLTWPSPDLPLETVNKLDFFDYNNSK